MRHDERIRHLNEDIDRLLRHPDATIEGSDRNCDELLGVAQVLAQADLAALSQTRQTTRQRLLVQRTESRPFGMRARPVLIGTVAALVLVAALVTVPPLHAMAQDAIQGIGRILFTRQPTPAEELFATYGELRFDDAARSEQVTLAQAQERFESPILTPTYLPEGMALQSVGIVEEEDTIAVQLTYGGEFLLTTSQMRPRHGSSIELPVGSDVIPQPVTVRGTEGTWLESVPNAIGGLASEEDPDVVERRLLFYDNLLTWEEDDVIYTIRANSDRAPEGEGIVVTEGERALSLEEIVQIAESLQPLE